MALDERARAIINGLQAGFPLAERPFEVACAALELSPEALLAGVARLVEEGYASRFGPLYNAERLGGAVTLAAMAVPEERLTEVAGLVNAHLEVAHNYVREHALNMWFVVAAERAERVAATLAAIAAETGLPVYDLPKREEYQIGFGVRVEEAGCDVVKLTGAPPPGPLPELDETDWRLVAATQSGLPLVAEPYRQVGEALGLTDQEVRARLVRLLVGGAIRRLGLVPNHYRLGLRANAMSVWEVEPVRLTELGLAVGALPFVTHCYHRPPHPPAWPYNLFAMVHGPERETVERRVAEVRALLGTACGQHTLLYSSRLLKKSGLRLGGGVTLAAGG